MIYEPLHPTYEIRKLDGRFDQLLQDECRAYAERQCDLMRNRNREIIEIRREYDIAKQKR